MTTGNTIIKDQKVKSALKTGTIHFLVTGSIMTFGQKYYDYTGKTIFNLSAFGNNKGLLPYNPNKMIPMISIIRGASAFLGAYTEESIKQTIQDAEEISIYGYEITKETALLGAAMIKGIVTYGSRNIITDIVKGAIPTLKGTAIQMFLGAYNGGAYNYANKPAFSDFIAIEGIEGAISENFKNTKDQNIAGGLASGFIVAPLIEKSLSLYDIALEEPLEIALAYAYNSTTSFIGEMYNNQTSATGPSEF